ncbi:MAG: tetratricopeptide repeat protein [Nitrospira sp.]|nr:tetratricopeptide repeat protein [Nitrospira sp.]
MQEKKGETFLSPEIATLSEKLQKDPSSRLFFPLAEEYIKCNMLEEAIIVLKDGLKIHPGFHAARVSLGKVYLQNGRVAEAKAEFEKVVAQNPDNLMAQKKLAQIYRDEGNIQKAKQICENILLTNAKDPEMKKLLPELDKVQAKPVAEVIAPTPIVQPTTSEAASEVASQISENFKIATSLIQGSNASIEEQGPSSSPVPQQPNPPLTQPQPEAQLPDQIQASEKLENLSPVVEKEEDNKKLPDDEVEERKIPVIELDIDEVGKGLNEEDIFSELLGPSSVKPQGITSQGPAPAQPVDSTSMEQKSHQGLPETAQEKAMPAADAVESAGQGGGSTVPHEPAEENVEVAPPGLEGDLQTVTLAELYVRQGHYEQGIEIYRKILEHNPDNEEVRHHLENALALANLLTKRPKDNRLSSPAARIPEVQPTTPKSDQPVKSTPEQLRQAKVQRLQAWLEQLKRSQNT